VARVSPHSVRIRAWLVPVVVAIAPVMFVAASDYSDRRVGQAMRTRVQYVADAIQDGERDVDGLARAQSVWVRVVAGGAVREADHAWSPGLPEAIFFGDDGASTLRAWDAGQPPIADRVGGIDEAASECHKVDEGRLLVCSAILPSPAGTIVVMDGSRRAIRSFYDPRYQLGRLTIFSVLLGSGLGLWLGWRLVRPIETLRDAVLDRVERRVADPLPVGRDDEIGDLARAYNTLLTTLEDRRRANESFAADLVHELKNPIAAIRTATDLLPGASEAERRARIEAILGDATGRMEILVRQFLELARAEAGLPHDAREPVDLRALVDGIVSMLEGVHVEVGGAGRVHAAPERVEAAIRNIITNATGFANAAAPRVHVQIDGGRIVVTDNGPGFAPEDLPRVFDRYFSRRGVGGTGLGLPLARAIVEAHGGTILAENLPDGGARVTVWLPEGAIHTPST
jgi:signal transduction histidine kinase